MSSSMSLGRCDQRRRPLRTHIELLVGDQRLLHRSGLEGWREHLVRFALHGAEERLEVLRLDHLAEALPSRRIAVRIRSSWSFSGCQAPP